ncbi:MAG: HEAT repeat domain-containing protein [Actinobacteria bacterium]|nr:HEAT repeat domain-containing protein [Actinomycetota bacterium]
MVNKNFKSDESFLEKISIGAIGTKYVFNDLLKSGHNPLELERCSMSFKIWKNIKIKRVRVPDILCTNCGIRVESRAKTNLELSMSHSISNTNRSWDYGLKDNDFVAMLRCIKIGETPIDWKALEPVHYINVGELRKAYSQNKIKTLKPKGSQEGYELRIIWPSRISNSEGIVINVSEGKIQYKRFQDDRTITLNLKNDDSFLIPLVNVDDTVQSNQIIASVVPITRSFRCLNNKSLKDYLYDLESPSISDRYSAIKALGFAFSDKAIDILKRKMEDEREHIYIRLESAAGLLKIKDNEGINFFKNIINDQFLENRLEGIITLSEIDNEDSLEILLNALFDKNQPTDIRAAAAWSMGELKKKDSIDSLVEVFNEVDEDIKIEAARALSKLALDNTNILMKKFGSANENEKPGIAWAIARKRKFKVEDLFLYLDNNDSRKWISYILGFNSEKEYINQIEKLKYKDSEVYFAVTVLWKILSSWIYKLEEY